MLRVYPLPTLPNRPSSHSRLHTIMFAFCVVVCTVCRLLFLHSACLPPSHTLTPPILTFPHPHYAPASVCYHPSLCCPVNYLRCSDVMDVCVLCCSMYCLSIVVLACCVSNPLPTHPNCPSSHFHLLCFCVLPSIALLSCKPPTLLGCYGCLRFVL